MFELDDVAVRRQYFFGNCRVQFGIAVTNQKIGPREQQPLNWSQV
jgi:hypothetical protein